MKVLFMYFLEVKVNIFCTYLCWTVVLGGGGGGSASGRKI